MQKSKITKSKLFRISDFGFRIFERGFTLVELLVVITIIALLTTIGIVMYQNATRRSRDGRRQTDLEQVRTALELYRSDNSAYPADTTWANLQTTLADDIRALPTDPKDFAYSYVPGANNLSYSLCAHLETGNDTDDFCGSGEACGGNCNYEVQNP